MTVADAQAAFARGVTAEALTRAFLARIETYNPRYNAVIFLNPHAVEERGRSTAAGPPARPSGRWPGPVVIKDTMDVAGLPTTAGWHFLCAKAGGVDLMPATDAPVVARMRAAGCVILGKTNVPVLSATGSHANDSWAGPTLNAMAPDLLPGGSSAGTATAVAASLAVLGLAEETGGSIQNPASAQGLVGIKPTFALVPNTGVVPLAGSTRDVVGPIARCVRDAALTLDALAGYTAADPKTVAGSAAVRRAATLPSCPRRPCGANASGSTGRAGATGPSPRRRSSSTPGPRPRLPHGAPPWWPIPSRAAASRNSASPSPASITTMPGASRACSTTSTTICNGSVRRPPTGPSPNSMPPRRRKIPWPRAASSTG